MPLFVDFDSPEARAAHKAQTSETRLAAATRAIEQGRTIYVCTYTRATQITPKTWKRFADAGHPVLKVGADGSLYMASGRRYVCIDLAKIDWEARS